MSKTVPLYNYHYFQSIQKEMERTNKYLIIDGNGTLWHRDDLPPILEQYQPREAINE